MPVDAISNKQLGYFANQLGSSFTGPMSMKKVDFRISMGV